MIEVKYKLVIGLEVHVEVKTKSKMFCGCSADYFGREPNTHVCPVCLGLPGSLPVPNKKAIEWCVMIGLALNCNIPLFSKFDRKNYFYPDLPKGYQISQYDEPFSIKGYIKIDTRRHLEGEHLRSEGKKIIRIRRVHMEEDTSKLIHQFGGQKSKVKSQNGEGYSLIDFNRSGVPLVEIVTEPDFESPSEVIEYLKKLQQIVRYLGVSDADMEKGQMRLEPNISLMMKDKGLRIKEKLPNYKVEVKNINSFRFVQRAINYEVERQKKILESGKTPIQETRGWDNEKQITVSQRAKEEVMDYRYFPEPDIPPVRFRKSQISNLKSQIPELPDQKLARLKKEYGLSDYDSEILTREKSIADYFEKAVEVGISHNIKPKQIANVIINKKINIESISPTKLIEEIITMAKMNQIEGDELQKIVKNVLEKNQKAVFDYKKGKIAVVGFLIGKVKQAIKQPLDTEQVKKAIEKLLKIN
jgi:aspartyl-tRNA(Asn)/glutamyl-tRNA(Gln) amidotransferase subunit B